MLEDYYSIFSVAGNWRECLNIWTEVFYYLFVSVLFINLFFDIKKSLSNSSEFRLFAGGSCCSGYAMQR